MEGKKKGKEERGEEEKGNEERGEEGGKGGDSTPLTRLATRLQTVPEGNRANKSYSNTDKNTQNTVKHTDKKTQEYTKKLN